MSAKLLVFGSFADAPLYITFCLVQRISAQSPKNTLPPNLAIIPIIRKMIVTKNAEINITASLVATPSQQTKKVYIGKYRTDFLTQIKLKILLNFKTVI
ncbi:hypothetical protein [Secundilactobacillus muriivasis]